MFKLIKYLVTYWFLKSNAPFFSGRRKYIFRVGYWFHFLKRKKKLEKWNETIIRSIKTTLLLCCPQSHFYHTSTVMWLFLAKGSWRSQCVIKAVEKFAEIRCYNCERLIFYSMRNITSLNMASLWNKISFGLKFVMW